METETVDKTKPVNHRDMVSWSFEQKMARTDFFVEANSNESHQLWSEYFYHNKDKYKLEWVQDNSGFMRTIGSVNNKPVCVSFFWYVIGKKYVCFYEATSQIVDFEMVENYLEKNWPIKYDNNTRRAMVDANNFHNCLNFCKEGEPKLSLEDRSVGLDTPGKLAGMIEKTIEDFLKTNEKEYALFTPEWRSKNQGISSSIDKLKQSNEEFANRIKKELDK